MTETKQIGLVACCSKKRETPCPAKDLYISRLFTLSRQYVEKLSLEWFIISAKYGIAHPDLIIPPYDLTLANMKVWDKKKWEYKVQEQLKELVPPDVELLMLAGMKYQTALKDYKVTDPLKGLATGYRLQSLQALITNEEQ